MVDQGISNCPISPLFVTGGKARGAIQEQYIRKTYLQVKFKFPYLRVRLPVIEKAVGNVGIWVSALTRVQTREVVLSPLQVAIESISRKTDDLFRLCNPPNTQVVNVKLLQLSLQGAVSVTVNEGPMQIAKAFLRDYTPKPDEAKQVMPISP